MTGEHPGCFLSFCTVSDWLSLLMNKKSLNLSKICCYIKEVGEYKNPNFRPWSAVEPECQFKTLWELLK